MKNHFPLAVALAVLLASPVAAQLTGKSVGEDGGPVSDLSTNVRDGSGPVHERGRTTRESSVGSLSGNSTRGSSVAPVKSGTMSDISAGSVTSSRSLRREQNEARLAPAPPRMAPNETADQVIWEPAYDLDGLVQELSAIEPMDRANNSGALDEPAAEEPGTAVEEHLPPAEE